MSTEWYALHVKPHKETSVCQLLQAREVELFYPTLHIQPRRSYSKTEKPYFPGYLFVRADLTNLGLNAFNWIPGTHGLVSFGEPSVIPTHFIHELKQRLKAEKSAGETELKSGDKVQIISGPFQGYEAIFDTHLAGKERVQVLLAFLARQQTIKLDVQIIKKVK